MRTTVAIDPSRITRPFQLLAAWLVGLVAVNASFLYAATQLAAISWLGTLLVVASVANVPIFLLAIFLLQTRFRPEMQTDSFYSEYLSKKLGNTAPELLPGAIGSIQKMATENYDALKTMMSELESRTKALAKSLETGGPRDDIAISEAVSIVLKDSIVKDVESKRSELFLNKQISLNMNLWNFNSILKSLKKHGVPVQQVFGKGASEPSNFAISIGAGFSNDEIVVLLKALQEQGNAFVTYADDETEPDQFKNAILIGSYGVSNGLTTSKLLALLDNNPTNVEIYKVIGK